MLVINNHQQRRFDLIKLANIIHKLNYMINYNTICAFSRDLCGDNVKINGDRTH